MPDAQVGMPRTEAIHIGLVVRKPEAGVVESGPHEANRLAPRKMGRRTWRKRYARPSLQVCESPSLGAPSPSRSRCIASQESDGVGYISIGPERWTDGAVCDPRDLMSDVEHFAVMVAVVGQQADEAAGSAVRGRASTKDTISADKRGVQP